MHYPSYHSIVTNFDLSVILPFYKKLRDFEHVLPLNASYFQRNGIEVIIVMDEGSEVEEVLSIIKQYPMINWRVLVNYKPHDWRNPCKAINAGIKAATKSYIMVCSPESIFHTDAIFRLRYIAEYYDPCFTIGKVHFVDRTDLTNFSLGRAITYGSILAKKDYFEKVGCYTESYESWGGEDDNIRAKLEYIGIKKIYVDDAVLIHYEKEKGLTSRSQKTKDLPLKIVHRSYYPEKADFWNEHWGEDFGTIVYDYQDNIFAEELCRKYLSSFKKSKISNAQIFQRKFKVVALLPTYNEITNVRRVLSHLDSIVDGIILLDDDSKDGTYETADSEKLILKAKKIRVEYNDLENRNLLLDLASFIKAEWFIFIDADERLVLGNFSFDDLSSRTSSNAYCFYLVHLWNSTKFYRTDLSEASPINSPGILHRWRMFKNQGHSQIIWYSKLHSKSSPFLPCIKTILPILIIHYGMLTRQIRRDKYLNYIKEDSIGQRKNYKYFLDDNQELKRLKDIPQLLEKTIFPASLRFPNISLK